MADLAPPKRKLSALLERNLGFAKASRPDEGSLSKPAKRSKAVLVAGKEPSPALSGTLSHCFATGEGENLERAYLAQKSPHAISPTSGPAKAKETMAPDIVATAREQS